MDGTRHLTKTFLQRSGNKSDPPSFEWPEVRSHNAVAYNKS